LNNHHLSGSVFLAFMVASVIMGGLFLHPALAGLETPATADIIQGKWAPQFEKSLNKTLPVYDSSRNLWGRVEYDVFGQGRKGVVVGENGWLFSDEELSCPPHARKNMSDNLAYILATKNTLAAKNTKLAIVIVPEKARVLSRHLGDIALPACRRPLYGDVTAAIKSFGIPVTDLLTAIDASPQPEAFYLKTDTHWTPAGARLASAAVHDLLQKDFPDLKLERSRFISSAGQSRPYSGDLARYIPGLAADELPPDNLQSFSTDAQIVVADASGAGNGLFDDSHLPQVTLVGTSYSANPNWNFAGFLKESLQADVLNAADEGKGPLTVMDKYFADGAWKDNPPLLLIWEIPERYLLLPHGVQAQG
jgi:alginate O-acetyltransferase complex protein AlgJ